MATSEKALIDAVRDDLAANPLAGKTYSTWLYVEPRELRPDVSPRWLVIHPVRTQHEIISTKSGYDDLFRIRVEWKEQVWAGMESNVGDQDAAEAALVTFAGIRERMQTYGAGIPGAAPNDTAELFESHYQLDRNGFWTGYTLLDVELFGGVL